MQGLSTVGTAAVVMFLGSLVPSVAPLAAQGGPSPVRTLIHARRLIDGVSDQVVPIRAS